MKTNAFAAFDIETIPAEDVPEDCLPTFDPEAVNIPANWGPEARAKKIAAEGEKFNQQRSKRLSTSPILCRVVSFCGYSSMDDRWLELYAKDLTEELNLLNVAWDWIDSHVSRQIPLVTFNGKGFDLQVLWHRAVRRKVRAVPREIYMEIIDPRRSRAHIDLCLELPPRGYSGQPEIKSFDYWLRYHGVGRKPEDWNGSVVHQAFIDGWHDDIAAYNRIDVENLRDLFLEARPYVQPGLPRTWNAPVAA